MGTGMKFVNQQLEELKLRLQTAGELRDSVQDLIGFLRASEYDLIQLMLHNSIWSGPVPPPPNTDQTGELQFGFVCYWVNNPPQFIQDLINKTIWLRFIWNDVIKPDLPTQINSTNYNALLAAARGPGVVGEDGTIFGESTYEALDPNWLWAFVDYLSVHFLHDRAPFKKNTKLPPVTLAGSSPNQVTIALVGDWGTGGALL